MSSLDYNFGDSVRAAFTHQLDDKTRHFGDVRDATLVSTLWEPGGALGACRRLRADDVSALSEARFQDKSVHEHGVRTKNFVRTHLVASKCLR